MKAGVFFSIFSTNLLSTPIVALWTRGALLNRVLRFSLKVHSVKLKPLNDLQNINYGALYTTRVTIRSIESHTALIYNAIRMSSSMTSI